jgi:Inhibitor of vertebrate lysozyme (Ivy)
MPGRGVAAGRYELYAVCEPHNCGGNFVYTLFAPDGGKAWALLTRDGGNYRFFGAPDQAQRSLLEEAAKQ